MLLSQQVKRNVIITNKNVKYELTDELPNDVRLKKNFKTQWNYSLMSSLLPNLPSPLLLVNTSKKLLKTRY